MNKPCNNGCFLSSFLGHDSENSHNSIVNVIGSSHDLEVATSSTLHPHTKFTNHEAIPSLEESYTNFTKAYPPFENTSEVDRVRAREYPHLNHSNVCFDYTGYGLFSHAQCQRPYLTTSSAASSSSCPPPSLPNSTLESPFFDISYKPVNLRTQILHGGQESELESKIRQRIMAFMNISEADYTLVFIANEVSAFKLVAESFQFRPNGELLTVYDHNSEAVDVMVEGSKEQGACILSAEFSWPNLGIKYRKLKKVVTSKRGKRKRGLFVFPLHSRVTGAPYSYVWMSMAQENGWHVLVDACAFEPKEMDTLGLTMFKPDFLVCSFYKVFGENPSGFGCLFVKKSSVSALKESPGNNPTSLGIISLFPAFHQTHELHEEFDTENEETETEAKKHVSTLHFPTTHEIEQAPPNQKGKSKSKSKSSSSSRRSSEIIECNGLEHADTVGLIQISCRAKYLINWLVNALMSLQHPHPHPQQTGLSLIKIYGPTINPHRGPAVAFNVFDWKGEKVDPAIVQKLADRNNISLATAVLNNIKFSDNAPRITVVTAALGFLTNFEDVYRLWVFLSRFLDADFVEKERWRYMALNQRAIDIV